MHRIEVVPLCLEWIFFFFGLNKRHFEKFSVSILSLWSLPSLSLHILEMGTKCFHGNFKRILGAYVNVSISPSRSGNFKIRLRALMEAYRSIKTAALTCNSWVSFGASGASEPPDSTEGALTPPSCLLYKTALPLLTDSKELVVSLGAWFCFS